MKKNPLDVAYFISITFFFFQETYASLMSAFAGCDEANILELSVSKVKESNPGFNPDDISQAAKSFFAKMVAADSYKPTLKVRVYFASQAQLAR